MRLLDTYALACGAKIDKPFLLESYFPVPFNRFVTFQAQSKFESKDYDYWQDVINIVAPVLEKAGIKIIQLGQQHEFGYQRVVDIRGQTSFGQMAYIMRQSLLHFGPDSLGIHIASSYDVPIVGLYSATMPEIAGPHWGSSEKQILFSAFKRIGNGKPSYSAKENPKCINTIRPEEIANAIFKLLGINFLVPFETVHLGSRYSYKMIRELVPDTVMLLPNPDAPIEIRVDLYQDDKILSQLLNYYHKAVIMTDKPINTELLSFYKPHISTIVYKISENDDPQFVAKLVNLGLPTVLVSELSQEEIQKRKIKYYEFGRINPINKPNQQLIEQLRSNCDKLYYKSIKIIASQNQTFASHAGREIGQTMRNDFEYLKVIDSPKFWDDLDFYTIVRKTD